MTKCQTEKWLRVTVSCGNRNSECECWTAPIKPFRAVWRNITLPRAALRSIPYAGTDKSFR